MPILVVERVGGRVGAGKARCGVDRGCVFVLGGTRGRLRQDLPIGDGVKLVKNLPNGDRLGRAKGL